MFYLRYALSELRRRRGRTVLTALGLAVGVGLVVTVNALSAGLDEAQSEVLDPLTGVGTEMSVARPLEVDPEGGEQEFGPGAGLSAKEQRQLQRENAGHISLGQGEPGERFKREDFVTTDLSFKASEAKRVAALDGVEDVAGGLTLDLIQVSGKIPQQASDEGAVLGGPAAAPPESLDLGQSTVSGIDISNPDLGSVTSSQVTDGTYLTGKGRDQAVLSVAYANEEGYEVGDEVEVSGRKFEVVGLARQPVGGQESDIYLELGALQRLSGREGRINDLQVRATSADVVEDVGSEIEARFNDSEVTTAKDLADQVSGSLVDAKDLSTKLGAALAVVALAAAFGIASLLTLSSVNKRTGELGTLKAVGWRQRLVVRQVAAESVLQGLIGGAAGAVLGLGGAALIAALGISLDASVSATQTGFAPPGFGPETAPSGSTSVTLGAPVDAQMIALAIGLAVLGGLIAGAVGGLRVARLRPAEALRSVA